MPAEATVPRTPESPTPQLHTEVATIQVLGCREHQLLLPGAADSKGLI